MRFKGFKSTLFFVSIIASLIGLNLWLSNLNKTSEEDTQNAKEALIDEYMVHAYAKQFDKEGQLRESLNIETVYHIYGQTHRLLKNPKLMIQRNDGQTWIIESKFGKTIEKNDKPFDRLLLTKQVQITLDQKPKDQWQLLTEALTIVPDEEKAFTDLPVTLKSDQAIIQSVGMESHLKSGQILLQNKVESTYETDALS